MTNDSEHSLRHWFVAFEMVTGERIDTIVLGWSNGWGDYRKEDWPEWDRWGIVTPVEQVPAEILNRVFDTGYGSNESPNLCGWSPSWVVFSDNYDGSEGLQWVPRSPIDHEPARPGGG